MEAYFLKMFYHKIKMQKILRILNNRKKTHSKMNYLSNSKINKGYKSNKMKIRKNIKKAMMMTIMILPNIHDNTKKKITCFLDLKRRFPLFTGLKSVKKTPYPKYVCFGTNFGFRHKNGFLFIF